MTEIIISDAERTCVVRLRAPRTRVLKRLRTALQPDPYDFSPEQDKGLYAIVDGPRVVIRAYGMASEPKLALREIAAWVVASVRRASQ